jgi:tetratricopeptide repeat protein 8
VKQAAWMLKCQCLIKENYVDELETEEEGIAELMIKDEESNKLAKAGTSFRAASSSNPVARPLASGRINTGFQRVNTRAGSRAGTRAANGMLRTGRIMTRGGMPATSNGRVLRLATASL